MFGTGPRHGREVNTNLRFHFRMLLDDLMGQSNFVEVIKRLHASPDTSPLRSFLAFGGEEQAYKMIVVAKLSNNDGLMFWTAKSLRPEVLTKVCELAVAAEMPDSKWSELKDRISRMLQDEYKQLVTDKTESYLMEAVDACHHQGIQK